MIDKNYPQMAKQKILEQMEKNKTPALAYKSVLELIGDLGKVKTEYAYDQKYVGQAMAFLTVFADMIRDK